MPRRNLLVIIVMSVVSLVCYQRAARNRYADMVAHIMNVIERRYFEEVDSRTLFEGAAKGIVGQLDEHSAYITPEEYIEFQMPLDQEFTGIGIQVVIDPNTERLTVMSPLIDSPAYKAGVRAGDTIMAIDRLDTKGLSLVGATKVLRGKPGTSVTITVLHRGEEETVELEIVRAVIQTDSVLGDTRDNEGRWNFFLEEDPRIGYVRMTTFGEHSASELFESLHFDDHPVDGLILDLRNNAGGILPVAINTCDLFVDEGPIVSTRGRDGVMQEEYRASPGETIVPAGLPVAVLVNRYSASASEIVAACLQDHGRAVIIGRRTWGKGTVQNLIPLEDGASRLKLTTASYWRPSGRNIHRRSGDTDEDQWGVKPSPTFEVLLTDEQFEKVFTQRRQRDVVRTTVNGVLPNGDDVEGHNPHEAEEPIDDPQLRRAIEFIQSKRRPKKAV